MTDGTPPQTHRRDTDGGVGIWEMPRLWRLAADLPVSHVPLSTLESEYGKVYWFGGGTQPTVRAVVDHASKVADADMDRPIILSHTGVVMDGMHRVAKAFMLGHETIAAVQFDHDPPPDRFEPAPRSGGPQAVEESRPSHPAGMRRPP